MVELNVEEGLEYCIDEELYLEVLSDYLENDKRQILSDALDNKDMHLYAVNVHSVKSTSKTIGGSSIFDKAYALELASKAGEYDKVLELHDDFIKDYSELIDLVVKYIDSNS